MRKRSAALAGVGLAGVLASGFPNRVGVTRSGADLSLPGDLALPTAQVQADRAREFAATPDQLWPELLAAEDFYAFLWDRPLTLLTDDSTEFLVWQTPPAEDWQATLTAALLPGTDGHTVVHLRERYREGPSYRRGTIPCKVVASAATVPLTWFRLRRSTK